MLKQISLTIAFTAMIFSVQALPLLYTFDGSINMINDEAVNIDMTYQLIMDFDKPGLEDGDFLYDQIIGGLDYDYGHAFFYETSNILYPADDLIYTTEKAFHLINTNLGSHSNKVFIEKKINGFLVNTFELQNFLQSEFQINDVFSVTERFNDNFSINNVANGIVKLTAISSFIPHPVPEPNTIVLLLLAISGLYVISKQKTIFNKC